jgi:hypothetical protein
MSVTLDTDRAPSLARRRRSTSHGRTAGAGAGAALGQLLAAGADPNESIQWEAGGVVTDTTPLLQAAQAGDAAALQVLLGFGRIAVSEREAPNMFANNYGVQWMGGGSTKRECDRTLVCVWTCLAPQHVP